MQAKENTHLKFVDFVHLVSWSSYALLGKNLIYTKKYSFVRIGEFLKRYKEQVQIQDGVLYKRPKIRINGNGITLRDEVDGKHIGTKNQFRIYKDQFLLSKIDARNGAFGVVSKELNKGIITGNFWTFDVDYNLVNPHYLTLLTGTKEFQKLCQTASVGTTNRNYLQEDLFLSFEIPLPKLAEQDFFLTNYNNKINQANLLKKQASDLEGEIEKYFLEQLGVKDSVKRIASSKLMFTNFSTLEDWGVENNLSSISDVLKSSVFKNVKLSSIVEINPATKFPKENIEISFIPMECVSDKDGEIIELRNKKISESKGYTKFQEGDLIWARITPCMQNGKSAIVKGLKNNIGCGSTEFHVIRNKNPNVNIAFIHSILRTETILQNAMSTFTGSAGQQRVPKGYLENLLIPLPKIEIQNNIVIEIEDFKNRIKISKNRSLSLKIEAEQEFEKAIFNKL